MADKCDFTTFPERQFREQRVEGFLERKERRKKREKEKFWKKFKKSEKGDQKKNKRKFPKTKNSVKPKIPQKDTKKQA